MSKPSRTGARLGDAPSRPLTLVLGLHDAPHLDPKELCARARALLERSGAGVLVCDASGVRRPDAGTVDTLARLQLVARRLGREVRLRGSCHDLQRLLHLTGLADVLPFEGSGLRVQPGRQAEQREQPRGLQERVHRDDPAP